MTRAEVVQGVVLQALGLASLVGQSMTMWMLMDGHQHDDSGDGDTAMMITFYIKIFPVIYICLTPASPAISHFAPQVVPRRTRLWWSSG